MKKMARYRSLVTKSIIVIFFFVSVVLFGVQLFRNASTPKESFDRHPERNPALNERIATVGRRRSPGTAVDVESSPGLEKNERPAASEDDRSSLVIRPPNRGKIDAPKSSVNDERLMNRSDPDFRLDDSRRIVSPNALEEERFLMERFRKGRVDQVAVSAGTRRDEVVETVVVAGSSAAPVPVPSVQMEATAIGSTRYIPHRCPSAFNKINDTEYDWFEKNVVQRSPLVGSQAITSSFSDEILILTPISNSAKYLQRYFENLCSLVYPHRLISIVLAEDSSSDGTVETAQEMVNQLRPFFKRVELIRLPTKTDSMSGQNRRHEPAWQFTRRRHLAIVRNRLMLHALGAVSPGVRWALWIDSDVRHIPRDLIRHVIAVNQSVVVPNCLWKMDNGQTSTYDRNTWQETDLSRAQLRSMDSNSLMLEGYSPTKRRYLNDLKTDGDVVPIDGVGGCVLLVDAELHRSGLVFPPYVFDHHIETEGFAKAVAQFGVKMFGLPSVNVIHW